MKKVKEMVELVHMQQLNSMPRSSRSNPAIRSESEILAEAVSGVMTNAPPPPPEGPAILQLEDQQTVPNVQITLNPSSFARYSTTAQVHSLRAEFSLDRLEIGFRVRIVYCLKCLLIEDRG